MPEWVPIDGRALGWLVARLDERPELGSYSTHWSLGTDVYEALD